MRKTILTTTAVLTVLWSPVAFATYQSSGNVKSTIELFDGTSVNYQVAQTWRTTPNIWGGGYTTEERNTGETYRTTPDTWGGGYTTERTRGPRTQNDRPLGGFSYGDADRDGTFRRPFNQFNYGR